ncbi:MAG TPA: patatin [Clostridiaceae bacterium]|nr:patatin [Clostridiaceae bacterium]
MPFFRKPLNLVLGGGGVKGIAYIGVFDAVYRRGYGFVNITGVSAGALAGSFAASGFSAYEMWKAMESFGFDEIQLEKAAQRLPVVTGFVSYSRSNLIYGMDSVENFLSQPIFGRNDDFDDWPDIWDRRGNFFKNLILFSKEGSLFDGDYLEEWVYKKLASKGVRTFADLRGGIIDDSNPRGYRIRMTGVDCNRAKVVILPDDMKFYGIDPDKFEVAKAVRISTCVPFAFKPVVIEKKEGNKVKKYNLVDGGVLDRFPDWLITSQRLPIIGFTLDGGKEETFFNLNTSLDILKSIISAVHNIGVPKNLESKVKYKGAIDTSKVSFLNFNLSKDDKVYLYNSGRQTANIVLNRFEQGMYRRRLFPPFYY